MDESKPSDGDGAPRSPARRAPDFSDLIVVSGALSVSVGAGLFHVGAGLIVGGALLILIGARGHAARAADAGAARWRRNRGMEA